MHEKAALYRSPHTGILILMQDSSHRNPHTGSSYRNPHKGMLVGTVHDNVIGRICISVATMLMTCHLVVQTLPCCNKAACTRRAVLAAKLHVMMSGSSTVHGCQYWRPIVLARRSATTVVAGNGCQQRRQLWVPTKTLRARARGTSDAVDDRAHAGGPQQPGDPPIAAGASVTSRR